MTRIIAGAAAAARLQVPARGTRPTSDKVREALFSALEAAFDFTDARVLDLYAGSGALGLEALSRGAESAVFVEKAPAAAGMLSRNCASVRELIAAQSAREVRTEVRTASVHRTLSGPADVEEFDLVFVDPPYHVPNATLATEFELLARHVSPDALVVVERDVRSGDLELPETLALWRRRDYGETALHFLEPA